MEKTMKINNHIYFKYSSDCKKTKYYDIKQNNYDGIKFVTSPVRLTDIEKCQNKLTCDRYTYGFCDGYKSAAIDTEGDDNMLEALFSIDIHTDPVPIIFHYIGKVKFIDNDDFKNYNILFICFSGILVPKYVIECRDSISPFVPKIIPTENIIT